MHAFKDLQMLSGNGAQGARVGEMRQKGRQGPEYQKSVDQAKGTGLSSKGNGKWFLMTQTDFCYSCHVDGD